VFPLDRAEIAAAAEMLLDRSDAFLGARHPLLVLDEEGLVVDLDEEAARAYGWRREDLLGRSVLELVPPEWHDHTRSALTRCWRGEEIRDSEMTWWTREGRRVPVLVSLVPIGEKTVPVRGVAVCALDMTELKRGSLMLRELEKEHHLALWLFEVSPLRVSSASSSYETIWRRPLAGLYRDPMDWARPIEAADRSRVDDAFGRLLQGHSYDERFRIRLPGGGLRWVHARGSPVRDATGHLTHVVGLAEDVTKWQEARERARVAVDAARHAEDRERRTLAADLHDTVGQLLPLAQMRAAELLEALGDSRLAASARELDALLRRSEELIRNLTFQLSPRSLSEEGLLPALEELASQLGQQYQLVVSIHGDDLPEHLCEDTRTALFRGTRELLINVARHARTDKAEVRIVQEHRAVDVTVEDAGVGFDVEARAPSHFGLLSVEERLRAAGGSLRVESAPGRGTRARMVLPLTAEAEEAALSPPPRRSPRESRTA